MVRTGMARFSPLSQLDRYVLRQLLTALVAVTTALLAVIAAVGALHWWRSSG